jgi:hypothetical protein
MPTVPDSPEVSGPRQRKPSMKATTNGDPNVERNRKRSEQVQKKGAAPAPTKKKNSVQASAKTTTATAKAAPAVPAASAKPAPQRCSVEVEEADAETDHHTGTQASVPPRNPRRILEAADGSDDDTEGDPVPDLIAVDNDNDDEGTDTEELEESAEAELSAWHRSCVRG